MKHWFATHPFAITLALYIILSNAVNAMPEPDSNSGKGYRWFFNFSHGVLLQAGRFMNKGVSSNGTIQK